MGPFGASGGKSEDTLMEEQMEITPYRMGTLMNLANKVTKQMLSGAWHLTYDEMEAVLSLIQCGINESREMNEKWKSSMKDSAVSRGLQIGEEGETNCS